MPLSESKAGTSQPHQVVFNLKKVKMKRPWCPLSDFSSCGSSTCRLEPWINANRISLDAPACWGSSDGVMASTIVSVNKSIGANLGGQMVKTSLHIWLWQRGLAIDLTLRWMTEKKSEEVLEKETLWAFEKQAAGWKESRQQIRPSSFQAALSSAACVCTLSQSHDS